MPHDTQFALFRSRRFLPLFLTQFLGSFNDNFLKSALVMLITYRLAAKEGYDARILVNIAGGIFILPYFIFSATAGQLADKYERSMLIRYIKIAEILIMTGAATGFILGDVHLLLLLLFALGAQATFFSPIKYSILPQHLEKEELVAGNGLIQMGTFISILTGTIFGGMAIMSERGILAASAGLVTIAALGWFASRYIPPTKPVAPGTRLSKNIVRETSKIIRAVLPNHVVFFSMIGISWFWFVGATFLAQFPTYAKMILGANEAVATAFLAVFSVGVGLGSMACNGLLKGEISGRYVPAAALGISIASVLLYFASTGAPPHGAEEIGLLSFLTHWKNIAILACLFCISFFGGLYIVPLYAIIQSRGGEAQMASIIACSNISDSIFMVASAVGTSALLLLGFSIPHIFLVMAFATALAAFLIRKVVRGLANE